MAPDELGSSLLETWESFEAFMLSRGDYAPAAIYLVRSYFYAGALATLELLARSVNIESGDKVERIGQLIERLANLTAEASAWHGSLQGAKE